MKKIAIILSVLAIIVSSCGQTTKKKANNELVIEEVQIEQEEITETQFPLIGNTIGFISFDFDRWYAEERHNPPLNIEPLPNVEILNEDGTVWLLDSVQNFLEYTDGKLNINREDFNPWAFEPSIGVFTIRCVAKSEKDYSIVVNDMNNDGNLVKHLKKHEYLKFQTIEEHVASRLVSTDFDLNPIREYPDDNAQIIDMTNLDLELTASIERKGDWIKIEDLYTNKVLGWIRWKKGDRFMIWLYYSV